MSDFQKGVFIPGAKLHNLGPLFVNMLLGGPTKCFWENDEKQLLKVADRNGKIVVICEFGKIQRPISRIDDSITNIFRRSH